MPEKEGLDATIAVLIDEAQQLERSLRVYKRRVLRNYLIPVALIGGVLLQIVNMSCCDCNIPEFWFYYAIGFWLAFPFVMYFFLRTRYRLGLKIRRETRQRKQIMAEIKQLSE